MSGADLATSRVKRLLRPLRNKCNSLAALPSPATASRVTYSKQSSNWDPDSPPPLIVLCTGTKKSTLDTRFTDEFELSRRIYAVCDAFKNIAHVAFGQPCHQRIPSLAAMCTLVIGGNMPAINFHSNLADSSEDPTDENDLLDVDGIYEAVPPHYRRYLIVSHALSMILSVCVHHHTLVTILFDHCLSFGLVHESTRLLNIILAQAFLSSNSSYPPPAIHPAHTNYLHDLHAKWIAGNRPSSASPSPLFTTSTFCQTVLDTLSRSSPCNSRILWTSKLMNRLLHVVESCDLDAYIVIIHALLRCFCETSGRSLDTTGDDAQPNGLRDKLCELISNLFDLLFAKSDLHSSLLTPSRIYAAIDILYGCHAARLHCLRMSRPGSLDLPDLIIAFTTHVLIAFRTLIDNPDRLLSILDDSNPVPTTFSKLMVYFSQLGDGQAPDDFVKAFFAQVETYSSALRSEKLFRLDASLWACALRHFEISITGSQKSSPALVTTYRQRFMEAVDAAERRCFGGDLDTSPIVSLPIGSRCTKRGRLSGHWEWEDMVGSWIRKTPVRKKRKPDDDRLRSHLYPRGATASTTAASKSKSTSLQLLTQRRRLSTLSPTTSSQPSESDGSDYQDESDKENCPSSPALVVNVSRPVKRQSSSFVSLLADAQTNRIVLHPKPHLKSKPPPPVIPEKYILPVCSEWARHAPHKQEQRPGSRKVSLPAPPPKNLLPSDDSLDLFAYETSSPARC